MVALTILLMDAKLYWGAEPKAESDVCGNPTKEYIYLNGKRIAYQDWTDATGGVYYYFADNLGSASVVADDQGNVLDESDYYPYGGENPLARSTDQRYKFTGKERDPESDLDYFGARYYSSNMGRWISPDWDAKPTAVPYADFADPQSLNLYGYVGNNPLSNLDKDGHDWQKVWQDVKTIISGTGAKATIGIGWGVKTSYGNMKVTAELASKANLLTSDGKLAISKSVDADIKATVQGNGFIAGANAEQVVGSVNTSTGALHGVEPPTGDPPKIGVVGGDSQGSASSGGLTFGQEAGNLALVGGEISFSASAVSGAKSLLPDIKGAISSSMSAQQSRKPAATPAQ